MAFISNGVLSTAVAARLNTDTDKINESGWQQIISEANEQAYNTILTVLAGRGYSAANIAAWDRRTEFNRRLGVCAAFRDGALARDYPTETIDLICKCEEELQTIDIIVGGVLVLPEADASPISYGDMDTANDVFSREWVN